MMLAGMDAGCNKSMSFAERNSKLKNGMDAVFQQRARTGSAKAEPHTINYGAYTGAMRCHIGLINNLRLLLLRKG
jgi:hypothetical protein